MMPLCKHRDGGDCSASENRGEFDEMAGQYKHDTCPAARAKGRCVLPRVSIVAAAWGHRDSYARHLASLFEASRDVDLEYCVGTQTEDVEHIEQISKAHLIWAWSHKVVDVLTDRIWPLPMVYNTAVLAATSDVIVVVGSDVTLPSGLLADALTVSPGMARFYTTHDADGREFIGPGRIVALPYCMAIHRKRILDIGGWDTDFADGICYDDNDLAARLLISGVRFEWSSKFVCVHQTHPRYHGRNQRERVEHNRVIWASRLNGYGGPLWPVENEPQQTEDAQEKLASDLAKHGYEYDCQCI